MLDDVDLDRAVSAGAWGSFLHQGQICIATSRHLVHESIAPAYVEALGGRLTISSPPGRGTTLRAEIPCA